MNPSYTRLGKGDHKDSYFMRFPRENYCTEIDGHTIKIPYIDAAVLTLNVSVFQIDLNLIIELPDNIT